MMKRPTEQQLTGRWNNARTFVRKYIDCCTTTKGAVLFFEGEPIDVSNVHIDDANCTIVVRVDDITYDIYDGDVELDAGAWDSQSYWLSKMDGMFAVYVRLL